MGYNIEVLLGYWATQFGIGTTVRLLAPEFYVIQKNFKKPS